VNETFGRNKKVDRALLEGSRSGGPEEICNYLASVGALPGRFFAKKGKDRKGGVAPSPSDGVRQGEVVRPRKLHKKVTGQRGEEERLTHSLLKIRRKLTTFLPEYKKPNWA